MNSISSPIAPTGQHHIALGNAGGVGWYDVGMYDVGMYDVGMYDVGCGNVGM